MLFPYKSKLKHIYISIAAQNLFPSASRHTATQPVLNLCIGSVNELSARSLEAGGVLRMQTSEGCLFAGFGARLRRSGWIPSWRERLCACQALCVVRAELWRFALGERGAAGGLFTSQEQITLWLVMEDWQRGSSLVYLLTEIAFAEAVRKCCMMGGKPRNITANYGGGLTTPALIFELWVIWKRKTLLLLICFAPLLSGAFQRESLWTNFYSLKRRFPFLLLLNLQQINISTLQFSCKILNFCADY